MRVPNAVHESGPWRIRELVPDFALEDVWALPAGGGAEDFNTLVEVMVSSDPAHARSLPTRLLWRVRDRLGSWFGLGRVSGPIDRGPGHADAALADRLPDDLRDTTSGLRFSSLPFTPLYRTDVEFAAELSNPIVHAVMHLAWVEQGEGRYRGRMAVYVRPRGLLGKGYMAAIKPFRRWVVYPAILRQIGRSWTLRVRP
jgi:hypothetical protein